MTLHVSDDGLRLLIDTLHIVRPQYVVQLHLDTGRETKHLPDITPEFVASTPGLINSQVCTVYTHLFTRLISFDYYACW